MIDRIVKFVQKIFGRNSISIKLPKTTNGVNDIQKSYTTPKSY